MPVLRGIQRGHQANDGFDTFSELPKVVPLPPLPNPLFACWSVLFLGEKRIIGVYMCDIGVI